MNNHKFFYFLITLMVCTLSTFAQNSATKEFGNVDELHVLGDIEVTLRSGNETVAEIDVMDISLDKVVTELEGTRLAIRLKPGIYKGAEVKIHLTYKHLREVRATAGARIYMDDAVSGDKLEMYAGSGGRIDAKVDVNVLEQRVMEGSRITVRGNAPSHECRVYSGGILEAEQLNSEFVFARVNTGGMATIYVKDELEASVGTGGRLTYHGNPPKESIKKHLGANVKRAE